MKLHAMLVTICALFSAAWIGCDRGEGLEADPACRGCVVEDSEKSPLSLETARTIQNRADAAFEAMEGEITRFESRIGPQPWPRDLPENWPKPVGASVLADTKGRDDGRLLLIDLSDSIDSALDSYRDALRESGFEVVQAGTVDRANALHASRGSTQATLRFIARTDSTRLEILFIAQ